MFHGYIVCTHLYSYCNINKLDVFRLGWHGLDVFDDAAGDDADWGGLICNDVFLSFLVAVPL